MTIRKIMVPLVGSPGGASEAIGRASLKAGMSLGKELQAHVEACCPAAGLPSSQGGILQGLPRTAIDPLFDEIERRNRQNIERAQEIFEAAVEAFLPARNEVAAAAPEFSASLRQVGGAVGDWGLRPARLADLIVAATNEAAYQGDYRQLLHALLTETGRPLFLVPATQDRISLAHMAIAWNGSSEASRAVAMLLELLERADRITLLFVEEKGTEASDCAALTDYMQWHGLKAETLKVEPRGRDVGTALQEAALGAGAGVLLMGAYTRSRLRRLVFGGASASILRAPRLPVIMVD